MFEIILALMPFAMGILQDWAGGVLSLILLIMIIIKAAKSDDFRFPMDMLFAAACLIPLSFAVSPLWAVDKGVTVLGFTKYLPLPLTIVLLRQYKKPLDLLRYIPWSGAVMTVLSLIFGLIFKTPFMVDGRLSGFFGNPGAFALLLLVGICYILFKDSITKLDYCLDAVLVAGVILSHSYVSLALLFVIAIVHIVLSKKKVLGAVIAALSARSAVAFIVVFGAPQVSERLLYVKDAFFQIIKHPLGLGYLGFYYSQPMFQTGDYSTTVVYNDLFQILIDIGWIPTLILGIAAIRNFIKIDRRYKIISAVMFAHLLFEADMQFVVLAIIFFAILIDYEADPEILKKKVSPIAVFTVATLLGIYFAIPSFLSFMGKDALAVKVYPCYTKSQIVLLSEAESVEAVDEYADKVLEYNDSVSIAYSAKARSAFSRAEVKDMIKFKTAAIERNKYSIVEYTDYIDMLVYYANLYIEAEDYDSAQFCTDKLKEVSGMIDKVNKETSSLSDTEDLVLPEEYSKIVASV